MTEREEQLRDMRRGIVCAALAFAAGALQLAVGSEWLAAVGFVTGALFGTSAALSWWMARQAQPWQDARPPDRPRRFWLILAGAGATCSGLVTVAALIGGGWLDALSWALWTAMVGIDFAHTREMRKATTPPKPPARVGPPQEWIP